MRHPGGPSGYLATALIAVALTKLPTSARCDDEIRAKPSPLLRVYWQDVPNKFCSDVAGTWHLDGLADHRVQRTDNLYEYLDPAGHPFGRPLLEDGGLRTTNQYSLEAWWRTQLLGGSPLLVNSVEEADIVLVCSAIFNSVPWLDKEHNALVQEFASTFHTFLPHLGAKPHVLVLAHHAASTNSVVKEYGPWFRNFTVVCREQYPMGRDHVEGWDDSMKADYIRHFVTVPYPGHIHYHSTAEAQDNADAFDEQVVVQSKSILVSESFFARYSTKWLPWRKKLKDDCDARPALCTHLDFKTNNISSMLDSTEAMRRAWYCFQPRGDTPLRQAVYDCLILGAVPVMFEWDWVKEQLPFKNWLDWTRMVQLIPAEYQDTGSLVNIVDALAATKPSAGSSDVPSAPLPPDQQPPSNPAAGGEQGAIEMALEKLRYISGVRHLLQYSMHPVHEAVRFDEMDEATMRDDAFTLGWKAIMRKLCDEGRITEVRCQLSSQVRHGSRQQQQQELEGQQQQQQQQQQLDGQQQQQGLVSQQRHHHHHHNRLRR